jgi:hypothetical protein
MLKRIIVMGVALIMCLGIFGACRNSNNKIDIGGEIISGEPTLSCVTRVMLDDDTFARESEIELTIGFGFMTADSKQYYATTNFDMVVRMEIKDFLITNSEGIGSRDAFKKTFDEYSDSKLVCTKDDDRYIPNYYETFKLKLIFDGENTSGVLTIQAGMFLEADNIDGHWVNIFYAANKEKIAFSAKSKADAQEKIK